MITSTLEINGFTKYDTKCFENVIQIVNKPAGTDIMSMTKVGFVFCSILFYFTLT